MNKAKGSTFSICQIEEVESISTENKGQIVLSLTLKQDEDSNLATGVVLSRLAAIELYHKLENILFRR